MATLTGAVIIALGDVNTGLWATTGICRRDRRLRKRSRRRILAAADQQEYSKQIRSDIADIKNTGRGQGGHHHGRRLYPGIVDKAKWRISDIAGTAWADAAKPHQAKGPTAVAIRTLLKLVEKSQ